MAKRLGLRSHAYCWRVAQRYRAGLMPRLPAAEPELLAFRDFVAGDTSSSAADGAGRLLPKPWWFTHGWESRDEIWSSILLTQEQKVQACAEYDRRKHGLAR
jgi:hypothetical protein